MDFATLHRALTSLEFSQLERNCLRDGKILDPIKMWRGHVMDGLHRLKIAEKHDLPYTEEEMQFSTEEEAQQWVLEHQLGKRNLSDFESQRLRAELAKLYGTAETAAMSGTSIRTVQRDAEASAALEKMSPDIREKCESGAILTSRSALKRYGQLTDSQRAAVDQSLRDHAVSLMQAIPPEDVTLTAEDFEALNANETLSPRQKRNISTGLLQADSKSLRKFNALNPEVQEVVAGILDDPDCDGLGHAIKILKSQPKRADSKREERLEERISKAIERLSQLFEDMHALKADEVKYEKALQAIASVESAFEEWRR
jgi:hypothetical protein